ncbi:FtsL-like putative cell division protein [Paludibacter sp.]|jgi:hypothetical protein|uniref:FtsL-like putative cell division protein n=1 Tax=Paludibacter sp. TaxID=1898105 RepID=UPI0013558D57|nr:FtsL-like putative cell division protein [Paludibacter sp.]MTK52092.1 hypothetical protein [Paludibacter sp.]
MDSTEQTTQPKETGKAKQWSFRQWMSGDILTTDFFRGQIFLFLLLCVIAIFYIDNRFACEQQIVKINRLKEQLTNAKYESLTTSSILMQISRQSQVSVEVTNKGIDLQPSSEPAIKIDDNEQ